MGVLKTEIGVTNDIQQKLNGSSYTIKDKNAPDSKSFGESLDSISARPNLRIGSKYNNPAFRIDPRLDGFGTVSTSGRVTGESTPVTQFETKGNGRMGIGKMLLIGAAIYIVYKMVS